MSSTESDVREGDLIEAERSLELRRPNVPTTINELAALEDKKGTAIIERRVEIFNTLRVASIRLTFPHDWTLFKTPEGQVYGFLDDAGCDRIKKLWGIQVHNLGPNPQPRPAAKITGENGEFAYRITGDGVCGMTGESVFDMEGVRYSTEPYAQQKPEGIQRDVAVERAARANLDGGIVRELAGVKSVPIEELQAAWGGTWKKIEACNKGRGFGSANERAGGKGKSEVDQVDIPTCPHCQTKLVFRPNGNPPFWGCSTFEKHRDKKVIINHDDLLKQLAEKKSKDGEQ
jgi:hypothetical protein